MSLYKGWHKGKVYNPDFLLGELAAILEVNPEAGIILRLHINPPYWWLRDNPEEICIYGTGDVPYVDNGEYERLIMGDEDNSMRVSFASEKWKSEASIAVTALLDAIKDTPQGQHVVGIQIAGGVYGEWHPWGTAYNPDYSEPMTRYFRRFLQDKYKTNEKLRDAWKDDFVTFDTAELASPYDRYHEGIAPYRDPVADQRVIDSLVALQRSGPDAIIHFSKIIRSCWGRAVLIGTFYGYYDSWKLAYLTGHLEPEYLLDSGAVDYFAAPFRYDAVLRSINGVTSARGFLESVRLHGVLWLTEMDNPPLESAKIAGGNPERRKESIAILRRHVLEPFTRGMGMWYFDHRLVLDQGMGCTIYIKKGWWDHPELMKDISMLRQVADHCNKTPYKPSADVLLVFGSLTRYYSNADDAFTYENEQILFMALGKSGVAYDSIYLHDINKVDMSRYRTVIFVNTAYIPQNTREFIKTSVATSGRHILWINAAGMLCEKGNNINNIEEMTGFSMKPYFGSKGVEYFNLLPESMVVAPRQYSLNFAVSDSTAEPVGRFSESSEIAAAVKRTDKCTQWYFSEFPADMSVLREIFAESGAFIYSKNGETLLIGNGIITVTSVAPSHIDIKLKNGKSISEELPEMTTAIYDSNTAERLDIKYL